MAEVLFSGKKISEMSLVNDITGEEKIPTSVVGDKAVTTGQLLTYLDNNGKVQWGRVEGDIANQTDLQNQFTQQLATLQNHIQDHGNPHNVTKAQVGLGLVDNTSDMDKPLSVAVQEALSLKADQTHVDDSLANKTHNSLLGRDADGAHPAVAILDGSGVTQQQVNDLTGAPYRVKAGGYNIGERVVLENGGIVRSTVAGNAVNPNTNLAGWAREGSKGSLFLYADELGLTKWLDINKSPPYTPDEYEQAYNNGIKLAEAITRANASEYSEVILEQGNYPVLYRNEVGSDVFNTILQSGAVDLHSLRDIRINLNGSTLFVLFDSNNKHQYNPSPSSYAPYMLAGNVFTLWDSRGVTFQNGLLFGDQYKRSWVAGENQIEQTHGITCWRNNRGIRFENMKFTGFRGDGVNGKPRGINVSTSTQMYTWTKGEINSSGLLSDLAGAYSSESISLVGKTIIDNAVQLEGGSNRVMEFRSASITVSFFNASGELISQEKTRQSADIFLPPGTASLQFTAFDDERTTATVTYCAYTNGMVLVTGSSRGFYFDENCEFYENHRGGVSNLGSDTYFFKTSFHDMGQLSKLGFPHYGDPTQYAINFEDYRVESLVVDGIKVDNVTYGVLSNSASLDVRNSRFRGLIYSAVGNYACLDANIENCTVQSSRGNWTAFAFSSTVYAPSTARIKGNTLEGTAISIDNSNRGKMFVELEDNISNAGQFVAIGDGKNLVVSNNKVVNVRGFGDVIPPLKIQGALASTRNILVGVPKDTTNFHIENQAASSDSNVLELPTGDYSRIPSSGNDSAVKEVNGIEFRPHAGAGLVRLSLNTQARTGTNTIDRWMLKNVIFNSAFLSTRASGQVDYKSTYVNISESEFKNGAHIELRKNSAVAGSKSVYFIKNTTFDLTEAEYVFRNVFQTQDSIEVVFLNCLFISDEPKSLSFIQGEITDVVASAVGCRFLNVTNTDDILVIS